MDVTDCIFYQLAKASQASTRFWGERMAPFQVTAVQGLVLAFLADGDGLTSREIGDRAQLDSATLTGILDRLEDGKIVERKPHPDDRRAILVCLTKKGEKLAADIRKTMDEANREFLKDLTKEDVADLRRLLKKVREQFAKA